MFKIRIFILIIISFNQIFSLEKYKKDYSFNFMKTFITIFNVRTGNKIEQENQEELKIKISEKEIKKIKEVIQKWAKIHVFLNVDNEFEKLIDEERLNIHKLFYLGIAGYFISLKIFLNSIVREIENFIISDQSVTSDIIDNFIANIKRFIDKQKEDLTSKMYIAIEEADKIMDEFINRKISSFNLIAFESKEKLVKVCLEILYDLCEEFENKCVQLSNEDDQVRYTINDLDSF